MSSIAAIHVPVRRPVARAEARSSVRLTRRGRGVVLVGSLLLMLALAFFWGAQSAATDEAGTPEPTRVVLVGPGDTLWDIASEAAADGEVRAMVDRIERINALDSAMLQVGQRLRVPTS